MKYYRITEVLAKYVNRKHIPDYRWEAAGDRGSRLHEFIKDYLNGIWISSVDIDVEPYFDSFVAFATEMIEQIVLVERELKCPVYGFVGHLDFAGILKTQMDGITTIDWKSPIAEGKTWKVQVSTYHYLIEKYGNLPMPAKYCGALKLNPKGQTARYVDYTDQKEISFNIFLQALNVHRHLVN